MPKLFFLIFTFSSLAYQAVAGAQGKSKAGPFEVGSCDEFLLEDPARGKNLEFKVYYPRRGGPYPVILFSHGFGGNKDSFGEVGQHWASHGYVVIHPSHDDGAGRGMTDRRKNGSWRPVGQPLRERLLDRLSDPEKIGDRLADLVLIMDNLDELPKTVVGLRGKIDEKLIGVGGHSFGAYTAMLIGGVTVDLGKVSDRSFFDSRVKCILPISGQGAGQQGLTQKSWGALRLPMMTITGTRDQGVVGQGFEWREEPYRHSPAGHKFLVVINGASHFSFGGGGFGGGGDVDIVKLCSTHFWDAYLKGSEDSKKYLRSGQLVEDSDGMCVLEQK